MPTMLAEVVGRTLLMVDGTSGPSPEDWKAALERAGVLDYDRVVVQSFGPPLSSKQRNELRAVVGDHPAPAAIITGSKLVETVVSILNLFLQNRPRAFPPSQLDAALDYVKLAGPEREQVKAALERMRGAVGVH